MQKVSFPDSKITHYQFSNLEYQEYHYLCEESWFPEIDNHAWNISVEYHYEWLLPDYGFKLTYNIPSHIEADTFSEGEFGDFIRRQTIEEIGGHKVVIYEEIEF